MSTEEGATPETTPQGATPETAVNADSATLPNPSPDAPDNPTPDGETPEQLKARLQSAEARIKELNKENEKRRKQQDEAEKAALAEQGKFKELYEKAQADLQKANEKRAEIERERLLDRVAAKHQLPAELRDRLRGDSEEDLEADAAQLAALVKPMRREAPESEATLRGGSDAVVSDEEQARIARDMGLNFPGLFPQPTTK